jgi:hypothetical protein
VELSWRTVERFKVVRHQEYSAEHRFKDHAELLAKVKVQGEAAIGRIEKFKTQTDIKIPLTYELALVQFS